MRISTDLGVWLAALTTLALYSFLYKENPAYRAVEHLYVGVAAGHAIAMGWVNVRDMGLQPIVQGKMLAIVPVILGILMFARFVRRYSWLARYPIALVVGTGSGLALRGIPPTQIIAQVRATFIPLTSINNLIIFVGVLGTLAYFLFTQKHEGSFGALTRVGKWAMMVAFGGTFGTTIFERLSLLIGTLNTLLGDWLGLIR